MNKLTTVTSVVIFHNHIHSQAAVCTVIPRDSRVKIMKLIEIWHCFTNPPGMAICLFGKWLLTLCVSCALQKSEINGAHSTPCCIPNWLASDQTSEPLCAFSLTVNAARYFILNENSPEFNFPFLCWKKLLKKTFELHTVLPLEQYHDLEPNQII